MKKVIVIGGGFGGLASAKLLARHKKDFSVTLIDHKESFDFLPLLPDALGRGISPDHLEFPLAKIASGSGFHFLNCEVVSIDLAEKSVATDKGGLAYDYLVIACGSQTNFYGNDIFSRHALRLDDAEDAREILDLLEEGDFDNFVVSGGGYTGIEAATNIMIFLKKRKLNKPVAIVERAPQILGPLPEWMKGYVLRNLEKLGIEVITGSSIEAIEGRRVILQGKRAFDNAQVIWCAGVKTPDFLQALSVPKNPQGRIKVDEYLRLNESCFAVGDAAFVASGDNFLRMAVQFSIKEGECAAENIVNSAKGRALRKYAPQDLGYIIPMANNRACGKVFGMDVRGRLAVALHFLMCIYRSYGLKNKLGIIKDLIK